MDSFVPSPDSDRSIPGSTIAAPTHQFNKGDTVIGRYTVLEHLGKGGMGIVYKCFDKISGVEVALKTIAPELSGSLWEMEGIKNNFQLVHNLHHDNIASYNTLEQDPDSGIYYLVMEYVDGEDLRYYLRNLRKNGGFSEKAVIKIVQEIAAALDYAHSKKILHRDIKPANIMIDRKGHVKLLDFGLAAQIHSSLSKVSQQKLDTSGTLPYIAPEQWQGYQAEEASDQYALSATVYEMFSGYPPFDAPDKNIMYNCVLNNPPRPLKNVSANIQNAVAKGLSKTPEERFACCKEFAAALSGVQTTSVKTENEAPVPPVVTPVKNEELSADEREEFYLLRGKVQKVLTAFQRQYPDKEKLPAKIQQCVTNTNQALGTLTKNNLEFLRQVEGILQEYSQFDALQKEYAELYSKLQDYNLKLSEEVQNLTNAVQIAINSEDITVAKRVSERLNTKIKTVIREGEENRKAEEQRKKLIEVLRKKEAQRKQQELEKPFADDEARGIKFSSDRKILMHVPESFTGEYQIPYGVTSIGDDAFRYCCDLTSVVIPDSVTSIGDAAFDGCSSLTSVVIPDSVTCIDENAFNGCSSLTSVVIPDSVTSIGDAAFNGCSSLTSVVIPDSVTSIGESAFEYCSSLTSVVIPDSVTSIGKLAFCDCSSLTNVVIPNSVTSIGEDAFCDCSSLTSVIIPDSVTSIGDGAFLRCKAVKVDNNNSFITGTSGELIDKINNRIIWFPPEYSGDYTIPDGVMSIGRAAFWGCRNLTGVVIPNSVTSIGRAAFAYCRNLTGVVIPNSVTSIGEYAFDSTPYGKKRDIIWNIAVTVGSIIGVAVGIFLGVLNKVWMAVIFCPLGGGCIGFAVAAGIMEKLQKRG